MFDKLTSVYDIYKREGLRNTLEEIWWFLKPIPLRFMRKNILTQILPVRPGLVLFGFDDMDGNCKPVYDYFINNKQDRVNPVWVTGNKSDYESMSDKELPVVHRDSMRGQYLIAVADVICSDEKKMTQFNKSTTSIRTFDEVPVKFGARSAKRENKTTTLGSWDYQLSTSEWLAEKLLEYKKAKDGGNNLTKSQFIISGFPRNDELFKDKSSTGLVTEYSLDDYSNLALYAPTRRARRELENTRLFPFDDFEIERLTQILQKTDTGLIIRFHPKEEKQIFHDLSSNSEKYKQRLEQYEREKIHKLLSLDHVHYVSYEDYRIMDLLPLIDTLITDYSSIYHTFLLLDRPILFIPYDYAVFEEKYGYKYDYFENLPGPNIESFSQFEKHITSIANGFDQHKEARKDLRKKVHEHEDGNSTERVAKFILQSVSSQPT